MAGRPRGEASTVLRVHSRVHVCVQGGPHLDGAVLDVSVCRRELRDGRRGFGGRGYAHSTAPPETTPLASRSRGSRRFPLLTQGHSGGRGTGQPREGGGRLLAAAVLSPEVTEELVSATEQWEAERPAPRAAPSAPRQREPADGKRSRR